MVGLALAMLIAASGQTGSAGRAAPAAPALAEIPKTPLEIAQENYERAQALYAASCGDRAYAAYDDLCGPISRQVHQYRVDLDKLERQAEDKKR